MLQGPTVLGGARGHGLFGPLPPCISAHGGLEISFPCRVPVLAMGTADSGRAEGVRAAPGTATENGHHSSSAFCATFTDNQPGDQRGDPRG